MGKKKEIVISQKEYAQAVENAIEDRVEDMLADFVKDKTHDFDFDFLPVFNKLHDVYVDHAADIREIVIQVIEEAGFPLRSDGKEF